MLIYFDFQLGIGNDSVYENHKHSKNGNNEDKYTSTQTMRQKRVHSMFTWKSLRGKNHRSPQTPIITMSKIQQRNTEATTSCSLPSPSGGYDRLNKVSLSLSLTITLCATVPPITLYNKNNYNTYTHTNYFP